jgi:hypothetical protein
MQRTDRPLGQAAYKERREQIAARHAEWEIMAKVEVRSPIGGAFNPYRVVPYAEVKRWAQPVPQINPHLERPPAIDVAECFLTALFLRRYVTYCARPRFAQMQGGRCVVP